MNVQIVISTCYGGFGLSNEAVKLLKAQGVKVGPSYDIGIARDNPILVQVVRDLGDDASDDHADLHVITIDDHDNGWYIHEYDGYETIMEGSEPKRATIICEF
jgi:hypothetical protein